MKKICLIIPRGLPVPALKGGAIETLMNMLADENEKWKKINLTIVSAYDKEAKKSSKNYKNTNFIYIKRDFNYILLSVIAKINNLISSHKLNTYNEMCLRKIKKKEFDKVIVEAGAIDLFVNYLNYFDKEKLVLHLHSQCKSNFEIDKVFDKIIAPSNYIKNEWAKTSGIKKYYILKNCINFKNFDKHLSQSEKDKLKKSLGFNSNDFVVGYFGRINPIKGVKEIIEAFLKIKNKNVKLLIVGSYNFDTTQITSYNKEIEKMVKKSNNKIVITGYVKNSKLYKYLDIMDVCVFASLCEEAAQMTLIEAMANKKAIISTISGGNVEYANKNAVIFINKDKDLIEQIYENILRLYENPQLCSTLSNEAYKQSLSYNEEKYYEQFLQIIEEMEGK